MSLTSKLINDLNKLKPKVREPQQEKAFLDTTVEAFPAPKEGTIYDFLNMAGKGYVEDITWGASSFSETLKTPSFAEMNTWEKIGYGAGTFGALMTPGIGPFSLLNKGGRIVAGELIQESTKNILKKEGDNLIRLVNNTVKNSGEAVTGELKEAAASQLTKAIKATADKTGKSMEEVIGSFSDDIRKQIKYTIDNTDLFQNVARHELGGTAAQQAQQHLNHTMGSTIAKSFKDAGIDVGKNTIDDVSRVFSKGVADGKHINELESLLEHKFAGDAPSWFRGHLSSYLGMAAQESLYMGIHGAISGKIKAVAKNEEFSLANSAKHSLIMGGMFPLIRLIPMGGHDKLSNGIKVLNKHYSSVNYKAMVKSQGEEPVRKLANIMFKQGAPNGSRSYLHDSMFKNGKYGSEIAEDIMAMTSKGNYKLGIDDVVSYLEQGRKLTTGPKFRQWMEDYSVDAVASVPRMFLGGLAMNITEIKDGHFQHMDSKEVMSHIMMAAIMTKSRGRWGARGVGGDSTSQYMKNWEPYYDVMRTLDVEPKYLDKFINTYNDNDMNRKVGGSLGRHGTVVEMQDVVQRNTVPGAGNSTGNGYNPYKHKKARLAIELANLVKYSKDGKADEIKEYWQYSSKELDNIEMELSTLSYEKKPFNEFTASELESKIIIDNGKSTFNTFFKPMLLEMKDAGLEITETETGVLEFTLGLESTAGHKGISAEIYTLLNKIEKMGLARVKFKEGETTSLAENKARRIKNRWVDSINSEFGFNYEVNDISKNMYLSQVSDAQTLKMREALLSVISGRHLEGDGTGLSIGIQKLLLNSEGELPRNFKSFDFGEAPDKNKDPQAYTQWNLRNSKIAEIHKLMLIGGMYKSTEHGKVLEAADVKRVASEWSEKSEALGRSGLDLVDYMRGEFSRRIMEYREVNEVSAGTMIAALENNLGYLENGKLVFQSDKSFHSERMAEFDGDKSKADKELKKFKAIKNAIGKENLIEKDYTYTQSKDAPSIQALDLAYEVSMNTELAQMDISAEKLTRGLGKIGKFSENLTGSEGESGLISTLKQLSSLKDSKDLSSEEISLLLSKAKEQAEALSLISQNTNPNNADGTPKEGFGEFLTTLKEVTTLLNSATQRISKTVGEIKDKVDIEAINEIKEAGIKAAFLLSSENNSKTKIANDILDIVRNVRMSNLDQSTKKLVLEKMKAKLAEAIKIDADKIKGLTLSELLEEYGENYAWSAATDLLSGINSAAQVSRLLNITQGHFNKEGAGDTFSKYLNRFMRHESRDSYLSAGETLSENGINIMDPKNPNKLNEAFVLEMRLASNPDALEMVINKWVTEPLNDTGKSIGKRRKIMDSFYSEQLPVLLRTIETATTRKVLSIVSGGNAVELAVPARRGINDSFLETLGPDLDFIHLNSVVMMENGRGGHKYIRVHDLSHREIKELVNKTAPYDKDLAAEIKDNQANRVEANISVSPESKRTIKDSTEGSYVYIRLSPQLHGVIARNEGSINAIEANFNNFYDIRMDMYNRKIADLNANTNRTQGENDRLTSYTRQRQALIDRWQDFVERRNSPNANRYSDKDLELMMLYSFSDYVNPGGMDKWMREISSPDINRDKLAAIEANMYKRLYLSDGGTSSPLSNKWIEYIDYYNLWQRVGFDAEDRNTFARFATPAGRRLRIGAINDEAWEGGKDWENPNSMDRSPFHTKRITADFYQELVANPETPQIIKDVVAERLSKVKGNDLESLDTSSIDGIIYIGHDLYSILVRGTGGTKYESNGWKPVIAGNRYDSVLGKGFLIYDPIIADRMAQGLQKPDLLMPKSTIKEYRATISGPNGTRDINDSFKMLEFRTSSPGGWEQRLPTLNQDNMLSIDLSELRLGFQGKDTDGVTLTNSAVDFESNSYMRRYREYQQYDKIFQSKND